jgi:uncharacterized membrane protein YqhA
MLSRGLSYSRYFVVVAVIGSLIASLALLLYSGVTVFRVVIEAVGYGAFSNKGAKTMALQLIELVDIFLLATVFYIIAVGLYELFIGDKIPFLPDWMEIQNLDDLKNKLIAVVIVVMGVLFLGQVVSWDGERNLLPFGASIALVIVALTYFLKQKK